MGGNQVGREDVEKNGEKREGRGGGESGGRVVSGGRNRKSRVIIFNKARTLWLATPAASSPFPLDVAKEFIATVEKTRK